MNGSILTVAIGSESDLVFVRQRARRIAELLGLGAQDRTRVATAVSEIARNALSYAGGGRAEFRVAEARGTHELWIRISDKGPGLPDLQAVLEGRYKSPHGLGLGIPGAQRLMDGCDIVSSPAGTLIDLRKRLPRATAAQLNLAKVAARLAQDPEPDANTELREQNQALLRALELNAARQEELAQVNAELEKTNRGVVALYDELDRRADELLALNRSLEERVAEALAERDRSEEHLRQAQKMEAVGQLTGGIAHDFNNLLQVIVGNLEIIGRHLPPEADRPRRSLDHALEGAHRASALTQRLLAFARRQPLNPKTIDVADLTRGMLDLLQRTVGEQLELEVKIDDRLWPVEADPHQLENVILNLAVNARHAMLDRGSGRLTIEASNLVVNGERTHADLPAGEYVALCVSDTGVGMSPTVLARAFEPFFTTKEVGQGTGLGLSQVYGFAKQSGGDAKIESVEGSGTAVTVFLPRSHDAVAEDTRLADYPADLRGDEHILVVEDDQQVRDYSSAALSELGYAVICARDGEEALRMLDARDRPIDLLFTDIVLPGGLNGRDLAERVRMHSAETKVLFTSGYARDALAHAAHLEPGINLLPKPFTYRELSARVRAALNDRRGRS